MVSINFSRLKQINRWHNCTADNLQCLIKNLSQESMFYQMPKQFLASLGCCPPPCTACTGQKECFTLSVLPTCLPCPHYNTALHTPDTLPTTLIHLSCKTEAKNRRIYHTQAEPNREHIKYLSIASFRSKKQLRTSVILLFTVNVTARFLRLLKWYYFYCI